jgi:hypothetical protein
MGKKESKGLIAALLLDNDMSFQTFSMVLITFGSILAIWGILTVNPCDIIHRSYFWKDRPGMIYAIFDHAVIQNYIRHRNKALLSLFIISLGFILRLPLPISFSIPPGALLLVVFLFYLLSVFIAGHSRKTVITSWKSEDCEINWFVKLLNKPFFDEQYLKSSKTGQEKEFLESTFKFFTHIQSGLGVDMLRLRDLDSLTEKDLEKVRFMLQKEVENLNPFYYFFQPRKLLNVFK